ncbi:MAG: GspH/FimT family pseudopilin [Porticoccaceae bacterium]|nr:GspH/FimT family pseudopilin [Porticoccaceae bacterium]
MVTPRKNSTRGFTLLELLVTLAIASILVTLGTPSFMAVLRTNKLSGQANDFISSLNIARSEAVHRSSQTTMCQSADGTSCGGEWENGWIVFIDPANTGVVNAGEEIILVNDGLDNARHTLQGNTNVNSTVVFDSRGYGVGSNGQLALCFDQDGDGSGDFDDQNTWVINISNTGRVRKIRPSDSSVSLTSCDP